MAAASPTINTYRALAGESRQALLELLTRRGKALDAYEAGTAVGLHSNTARAHLMQLVAAGLVVRVAEERAKPGRPRVLFRAVHPPPHVAILPSVGVDYRELSRVLADQIGADADAREKAVEAGRRWAAAVDVSPRPRHALSRAEAVGAVVDVLRNLGFDPESSAGDEPGCIRLRRCPFADIARENRSVVCAVHLGMLRETFEKLNANVAVGELRPFVSDDPLRCEVDLVYPRVTRRRAAPGKAKERS